MRWVLKTNIRSHKVATGQIMVRSTFKGKELNFESGMIDIITPPLQTGRDISGYCDLGDIYLPMKANLLNAYQS